MENMQTPIKNIGENKWIENLSNFLEEYDVEVFPLENIESIKKCESKLNWKLPNDMKDYYLNFGGIDSSDFMYNLKQVEDFAILTDSEWEFIQLDFENDLTKNFIVFSESFSNEPICINKNTYEIYLFSHDPLKYGKIYNNFNDFLINEIINIQELLGDLSFKDGDEKMKFLSQKLSGDNIDYNFRHMKME